MSGLVEFLEARIAEDEAAWSPEINDLEIGSLAERILDECDAKRRIIVDFKSLDADYKMTRSKETEARRFQALVSIGQLAIVHDDHPDYDDTWRP